MPRTEAPRWTLNERKRSTCFGAYEFALCGWASAPHNPAAARSREPGQVRREWIAESGFSVGMARRRVRGRWPPHVEYREWPTVVVDGRAIDDYKAERLVEAARRGVLLVDVDRQVAVA